MNIRKVLAVVSIVCLSDFHSLNALAAPALIQPQLLHFAVTIGPDRDVDCDIVGDLYLPATASPTHRVPALIATHGFGGSKEDQRQLGLFMSGREYAVLAFSSLGFGGSSCRITMDTPEYDGVAVSQLISFLGGAPDIAFEDSQHTVAVPPLEVIQLDTVDHFGQHKENDPRVGMIGASYGGAVQFAAASIDSRLDTIVPMITWNDTLYSLAPNNADLPWGVDEQIPGPSKYLVAQDLLTNAARGTDSSPPTPWKDHNCPRFYPAACQVILNWYIRGIPSQSDIDSVRYGSVVTYSDKIHIPVLLTQGQEDTIFLLNEAAATFSALRHQGTPVKMLWHRWGHDTAHVIPGELNWAHPDREQSFQVHSIVRWFDHYLRDDQPDEIPVFSYFRDWIPDDSVPSPWEASPTYPVPDSLRYCITGDKALQPCSSHNLASSEELMIHTSSIGESLSWNTPVLDTPLTVVGIPEVTLHVSSEIPATLFLSIVDVSEQGDAESLYEQIAPARVQGSSLVHFTLPGIVHRFESGHQLRLIVSGQSQNFRADIFPIPVRFSLDTDSVLALPIVQSTVREDGNPVHLPPVARN